MRAMYHIDKGVRHYFRLSDQRRNYNWQAICAKKKKKKKWSTSLMREQMSLP